MNRYRRNLAAANNRFDINLAGIEGRIKSLREAKQHELQDDWDDALNMAADRLQLACEQMDVALRNLREGS